MKLSFPLYAVLIATGIAGCGQPDGESTESAAEKATTTLIYNLGIVFDASRIGAEYKTILAIHQAINDDLETAVAELCAVLDGQGHACRTADPAMQARIDALLAR